MEVWAICEEDFAKTLSDIPAHGRVVQIAGYNCFQLTRNYRPAVLVNTRIAKADFSEQSAEATRIANTVRLAVVS